MPDKPEGLDIRMKVFIPRKMLESKVAAKTDEITHLIQKGISEAIERLGDAIVDSAREAAELNIKNTIRNYFERYGGEGGKVVKDTVERAMAEVSRRIQHEFPHKDGESRL